MDTFRRLSSSATSDDLWRAIQADVNLTLPVVEIMKNWTEKSGYPLLSVTVKGQVVSFEQRRFALNLHVPITWAVYDAGKYGKLKMPQDRRDPVIG